MIWEPNKYDVRQNPKKKLILFAVIIFKEKREKILKKNRLARATEISNEKGERFFKTTGEARATEIFGKHFPR